MKRTLAVVLILLVFCLSACGKEQEAKPTDTVPETTAPLKIQPELEYVIAEVNGIPAVLETLSRGDSVDIVEAFDEKHYVVKLGIGYGLVEKNLVRPESEPEYEAWTGYAYHNAELFDNYRLTGEPVKKLASNTKVEVLDDLGWCVLVDDDGVHGYMRTESLKKNPLSSSGGNSRKEPFSGNDSAGEDGGEIWLQTSGKLTRLSTLVPQEGNVSGKATVLADGTDVVLGYFDRGDRIPVIKKASENGRLTVCLDGLYAYISDAYVCAEGERSNEAWEGKSNTILPVYADIWMLGSPIDRLNANTVLTVLYELENCYLVETENVTGYIPKEFVDPVKTESNPEGTVPTQPAQTEPVPTETEKPEQNKPAPTAPEKPEQSKPTEPAEPEKTDPPAETEPSGKDPAGNSGTGPGNPDPEWSPPVL